MKGERAAARIAITTVVAAASHALALIGVFFTRPSHLSGSLADPADALALVPVTLESPVEPTTPRADAPLASPHPAPVEPDGRVKALDKRREGSRAPSLTREPASSTVSENGLAAGPTEGGSEPGLSAASSSPSPPSPSPPSASVTPDLLPPPLAPRAMRAPSAVFGDQIDPLRAAPSSSAGAQLLGSIRALANQGAPQNGRGVIRIEVDATGAVTGVTSSSPSWEKVARSLAASLVNRRVRVPSGKRGLVITYAVDADVTTVPPAITGEVKATPCKLEQTNDVGRYGRLPDPGCIDVLALLPIPRHRVTVKLLGEQVR